MPRLAPLAGLAAAAAAVSLGLGWAAAGLVEASLADRAARTARAAGLDWLALEADGAILTLSGAAPDADAAAAAREAAAEAAGRATLVDRVTLAPPPPPPPAEPVALEILVAPDGVTVSGLAPDAAALDRLAAALSAEVSLASAPAEATPDPRWAPLETAAAEAARLLAHGRVAVALAPQAVAVSGLPRDEAARAALGRLAAAGAGVTLALEPPPPAATLAPAPAAEAEAAQAARPAAAPATRRIWLRVAAAPDLVTLTGAAPDAATRAAVLSYAVAAFGADRVHDGLAVAPEPGPEGWRAAAFAALDALARLDSGRADVAEGRIEVAGVTLRPAAAREAQAALAPEAAGGWPAAARVTVDLPALAAAARLPPGRCAEELTALSYADPIRFEPSSAAIDAASGPVLDALAATLARCEGGRIEVGGHTDSQGSEGYNQRLSQARADAVRDALVARGAEARALAARGYGESAPVADNADEAGRARNRRIAFSALAEAAALTP